VGKSIAGSLPGRFRVANGKSGQTAVAPDVQSGHNANSIATGDRHRDVAVAPYTGRAYERRDGLHRGAIRRPLLKDDESFHAVATGT
jgi:hypothetical protein